MKRYTSLDFPPYRHEPGRTPHPERSPGGYRFGRDAESRTEPDAQASSLTRPEAPPDAFDEHRWRQDVDYLYGVDLFNAGYFWEAHAVWEELWTTTQGEPERRFLQALIQIAAGCLKRSMGQSAGARKLFRSALARLDDVTGDSGFAGVDLTAVRSDLETKVESGTIHIVLRSEGRDPACYTPNNQKK